jgi:hypothetical protein
VLSFQLVTTTPPAIRAVRANRATMLPTAFEASRPGVTSYQLTGALVAAMRLCDEQHWAYPDVAGYRLFWSGGGVLGFRDLPAWPHAHLVLGRHSGCDVMLDADERMSLRHLIARAIPLDDGSAVLRLLDLHTNLPMFLGDGIPHRSLVVHGAVALSVGPFVIGAFPMGVPMGEPFRFGRGGPYRELPRQVVYQARDVPRASQSVPRITRITSLPPLTGIGELREVSGGPSIARLTLRGLDCASSVALPGDQLEIGVLVGRAPKCLHGLLHVLHSGISRAHLLLLRESGVVHCFDLASSQGTYERGRRIRHARLSPYGTRIELACRPPVTLDWQAQLLH